MYYRFYNKIQHGKVFDLLTYQMRDILLFITTIQDQYLFWINVINKTIFSFSIRR